MNGLWDKMEELRGMFEQGAGLFDQRIGMRMGKGDVRAAILALLAEEPMHGYQLIHEIERRSDGMWKPSPGSVYPTLQLLADEGLVSAAEANGRKTYSLTDAGEEEAAAAGDQSLPWETSAGRDAARGTALPKSAAKLAQAVVQVGRSGTKEQIEQAIDVIDDARRKLYSILSQA